MYRSYIINCRIKYRKNPKTLLVALFCFALVFIVPGSAWATASPLYHKVQAEETIYGISLKYGVKQAEIVRLNDLQNNMIYEGQKLLIKGEKPEPEPEAPEPPDPEPAETDEEDITMKEEYSYLAPEGLAETAVFAEKTQHSPFVLDVRGADLRDVLSILAIRLGKTIILMDEPVRVSFTMEGTSPLVAMKLLLQREGFEYLEEGQFILVGRPERLRSDFVDQMSLSRFNLQYVNANTLLAALSEFDIQPRTFTVETNPRAFWAQGTPRDLSRVREIINALDRPENVDMETDFTLERFNLQYLAATTFEQFVIQLGIDTRFISLPANPQAFWVQGGPHDLERIQDLISSLDRPENTGFEIKLDMERFALSYVPVTRVVEYLEEVGIDSTDIHIEENAQAIWVYGPPQNLEIARELIGALDRPGNAELLPRIFVYSLRNISAADATERIETMGLLPGIQIMNFSFPGISQELLIICPPHLQEQVYSLLGQLDEPRQRIRRPVDSATGENARNQLIARRELLAQLTGIPISRMHISGNLSGDSASPYHVLWVEETPDKIEQVRDMIGIIEAPRN